MLILVMIEYEACGILKLGVYIVQLLLCFSISLITWLLRWQLLFNENLSTIAEWYSCSHIILSRDHVMLNFNDPTQFKADS